jgi:predicted CoA-binding protein
VTRPGWERPEAALASAMAQLSRDAVRAMWIDPTVANDGDVPAAVLAQLAELDPVQLFVAVTAVVQEAARISAARRWDQRRITALENRVAEQDRRLRRVARRIERGGL